MSKVKFKYKINLNSKLYEKSNNVTSHDSQTKVKIFNHDSNDSLPLDESKPPYSFSQKCFAPNPNSHNEFISNDSNFNIGGDTNYTRLGSFIDNKSADIVNIIEPILVDEKSTQVEPFDTISQTSDILIFIDPFIKDPLGDKK